MSCPAGVSVPMSLKFAALSVDSYHLDSPPFTGSAVGSGGAKPLTSTSPHPSSDPNAPSGPRAVALPAATMPCLDDGLESISADSPSAPATSPPSSAGDQDVTPLDLDRGLGKPTSPAGWGDDDRPLFSSFHLDMDRAEDSSPSGKDHTYFPPLPADPVPVQAQNMADYAFPKHRLPLRMHDESKTPLVIVACGSFSPPTYLHLRMFEMAKDAILESGEYELLAGYYSPVSDLYKKAGLAPSKHRVRMCELAVEKTSTWLMVDAWESLQDEYQRTAVVLDHFDRYLNHGPEGGISLENGSRKPVRIMLLAGGDLIQSMGEPGVWAEADLRHILGRFGCLIVERTGADVSSFLLSHDLLWAYRRHLLVVKQTILRLTEFIHSFQYNDISSSKVRLFIKRNMSVKYLLPNSVINYINQHRLYRLPPPLSES